MEIYKHSRVSIFLEPRMMDSWGISGHPHCPPKTNVNPSRWGEPMIRLKGMTINDDLKAGEEVSTITSVSSLTEVL
jgi:hypothetical protein